MRKWIAVAAIAFLILQAPTVAFEIFFALVPIAAVVIAFKAFTSPKAMTVPMSKEEKEMWEHIDSLWWAERIMHDD